MALPDAATITLWNQNVMAWIALTTSLVTLAGIIILGLERIYAYIKAKNYAGAVAEIKKVVVEVEKQAQSDPNLATGVAKMQRAIGEAGLSMTPAQKATVDSIQEEVQNAVNLTTAVRNVISGKSTATGAEQPATPEVPESITAMLGASGLPGANRAIAAGEEVAAEVKPSPSGAPG